MYKVDLKSFLKLYCAFDSIKLFIFFNKFAFLSLIYTGLVSTFVMDEKGTLRFECLL